MTHEEIDKIVEEWADEAAEEILNNAEFADDPYTLVFEAVDSGWTELGFPGGLIDSWPVNPGGDTLKLCGDVLDYCEKEGWIENDSGLWEGCNGAAVLGCQAFHSLQNVLWQKLRDRNIID